MREADHSTCKLIMEENCVIIGFEDYGGKIGSVPLE